MRTTVYILIMHFSIFDIAQAQNPDMKRTLHWYFGADWDSSYNNLPGAGLDFTSGMPVPDTSSRIYAEKATVSMSDTSGDLLFYASPDTIYDKQHSIMDFGFWGVVSTNGDQLLAVPLPENDSIYYFFYARNWSKLWYAVINMNANGGMGAVLSKHNVLIDTFTTEKIAGTYHCNGRDVWIAGKQRGDGPFYIWLLTDTGLSAPIISNISGVGAGSATMLSGSGDLVFSPDGSLAATIYLDILTCDDTLEIYRFDNCTGQLFSPVTLPGPNQGWGLAFSPDGTKLYVPYNTDCFNNLYGKIDQYDVSVYNRDSILASRQTIYSGTEGIFLMQPGPDGRIYVCDMDSGGWSMKNRDFLGVINNPNEKGISCNYTPESVYLGGKKHFIGLPCFISNYFRQTDTTGFSEDIISSHVTIYPSVATDEHVMLDNVTALDYDVTVHNAAGQEVLSSKIQSLEKKLLDLSILSAGFYTIELCSNRIKVHHKIIKP